MPMPTPMIHDSITSMQAFAKPSLDSFVSYLKNLIKYKPPITIGAALTP